MTLTTFEASLAVAGDVDGLTRELEEQRLRGRELAHDRNPTGDTLLHLILDNRERPDRSDVIRLLVRYGGDVNALNHLGMAPLHLCVFPGETNLLLDFGARIDARDGIGCTRLHFAALDGDTVYARFLLQRGADPTVVDDCGDDATSFARLKQNKEFAGLLTAVKRAGSWQNYLNAHRIALALLRTLCERGRARPPSTRRDPILARLFAAAPPPSSTKKAARLASRAPKRPVPNETFWHILAFWRTDRDD